ncbi:sensor histidine kinase [Candidatus Chloroploca sp. Khr17]|uniref:sensor histidine kinase n=1 Tax=Candidatus Chloroploca sp. Khr17 TaxID=2496869 RepID=UPI0013EDDD5C|nr:histidine kinase dimerization/phosphoacceptor domain -containing protein [Candidatus Chloroploca sp. Khr17]
MNRRLAICLPSLRRRRGGYRITQNGATDSTQTPAALFTDGLSESEERYRRLFEASPDAIVLTDDRGVYLDVNEAAVQLFGVPRTQLIGMSADQLREDRGAEAAERHRHYLEVGRDTGEFPFRRPDGTRGVAQYTAVRVGPNLHQSVLRDITAVREDEVRLRNSLNEKEVLLKEIHHRVKNNLQVIASMLRLQSDRIDDPQARELFLESQRRVRAMALIHERLYQAPDLARIDLAAYVRALVADLLRAYRVVARNVVVCSEIEVPGIDVDQAMALGLLLNELLTNSLRHAFLPGQSGTITITGVRDASRAIILKVADNGAGLPADFEPAISSTMGLQIIHALAAQIGGKLLWQHSPGTTVTLLIPESTA